MATLITVLIGLGVLGVLILGGRAVRGVWGQEDTGALLARWSKRQESLENMIADLSHDRETRTLSPEEYDVLSRDAQRRLDEASRMTAKLLRARYSRVSQRGRKVPARIQEDIEKRVRALRQAKSPARAAESGA